MQPLTLINGSATRTLASSDRGLCFGQGVTTSIRVSSGQPELWSDHLNALEQSAKALGFVVPGLEPLLKRDIGLLPKVDLIIKVILTAGIGDGSYQMSETPMPTRIVQIDPIPLSLQCQPPATLFMCHTRLSHNQQLAGIKCLNRTEHLLASCESPMQSMSDGLMMDPNGCVISSTRANLFILNKEGLITPDLSRCGVAGVMRQTVIRLADRLGIPLTVADCSINQILSADALFLTNAVRRIWPVVRFEQTAYSPSPVIERLQRALEPQLV